MVKNILRLEGLVISLSAIYLYYGAAGNWIFFFIMLLVPDISMVGYLKNKKLGAITYNVVHNYILALILIFTSMLIENPWLFYFGLILTVHVGLDRFMGFGLKYPTNFKDTHIQKV